MSRLTAIIGALAVLMLMGLTNEAHGQERPRLAASASCIDAQGKYTVTWTLTLALGPEERASAESPMGDFDGLDLIGQPQEEGYPFQAEAGNIFTSGSGRLVNGANVARTQMDTSVYNPDTVTAAGRVVTPRGPTEIEVVVNRPARCAA